MYNGLHIPCSAGFHCSALSDRWTKTKIVKLCQTAKTPALLVMWCYKLGVSNTSLSIRYLNIHENLKISIWVGITIDDYGKI